MKKWLTILNAIGIAFTWASAEVEMKPLNVGMAHEYGQMRNLTFLEGEAAGHDDEFTINRSTGWFSQSAILNNRIQADLALGGLFFHFFPTNTGADFSLVRISAVSISQASLTYKMGDWEEPDFSISIGMMPYKYSESKNLGEYLFRSLPYPTTTINGSWDIVNSAFSKVKGFLFEKDLLDQSWKNDLLLYVSDEQFPLHDMNLAWVTSFTFGPLELGAGVNFFKILSYRPSRTTPKSDLNSYFDYDNTTWYGDDKYYKQVSNYFKDRADTLTAHGDAQGAAAMILKQNEFEAKGAKVDSLNNADAPLDREYYSYKGTLLMGRFTLDIGALIGDIENFKFYGEADLLGWKNYPVFYDSKRERVPIMLGISLPTMGILDYLNFEVEYWENPYPISLRTALVDNLKPRVDFGNMSSIDLTKPYDKDNWKWNVSAQRSIGKYIAISMQIANDHTRPIRYDFYPYLYETMLDPKAWYYVLRLQLSY